MSEKREIYTESWFDNKRPSIDYALSQVTAEGMYVEIGSFEGKSTVYIANKIHPHILYAVDTWAGGEFAPYEQMKYSTTAIEAHFDNNIEVATQGNVNKCKMDWRTFFEIGDASVAFIYVDGPHDYESVYESLLVITPRMAPGGVMCGDDYDDPSVFDAVNHAARELNLTVENLGPTWVVKF